jgi:hypothetical protein
MLAGNTQQRGDLGLALAGRRDHLAQQFAGVRRTPLRIAFHAVFGHALSSMILLEIDAKSISSIELEGDAPRPVDMDRVAGRYEAFQGVEIKPGKAHLRRCARDIQPIEADQDALTQLGVDLGRAAFRPQLGQRFASERPDHTAM